MTRLLLDAVPDPPGTVEVGGEELRYLTRVRRHGVGDHVELRDAGGQRFEARVADLDKRIARLEIERVLPPAPESWPVTLIVAVPKGPRLDDVVRKSNEIGVASIAPVTAARSSTRPGPGRVDRWRRIATESTRQCGRRNPVRILDVTGLEDSLAAHAEAPHTLILDPGAGGQGLTGALAGEQGPVVIAIGPEGGFTASEIESAARLGFLKVGLGAPILRVETAAIAAATLAVAFLGGFD